MPFPLVIDQDPCEAALSGPGRVVHPVGRGAQFPDGHPHGLEDRHANRPGNPPRPRQTRLVDPEPEKPNRPGHLPTRQRVFINPGPSRPQQHLQLLQGIHAHFREDGL